MIFKINAKRTQNLTSLNQTLLAFYIYKINFYYQTLNLKHGDPEFVLQWAHESRRRGPDPPPRPGEDRREHFPGLQPG